MCGKDVVNIDMIYSDVGSPPHVRERLRSWSAGSLPLRITPACAGKTRAKRLGNTPIGDHPRMCGKDS